MEAGTVPAGQQLHARSSRQRPDADVGMRDQYREAVRDMIRRLQESLDAGMTNSDRNDRHGSTAVGSIGQLSPLLSSGPQPDILCPVGRCGESLDIGHP
jgi:hypothetical protein